MNNLQHSKSIIIFLCTYEELQRERKGYADAFKRLGYKIICSGNIKTLKHLLKNIEHKVLAVIQPEGYTPIHPFDIYDVSMPTIIFQWDTFTRTKIRAKASLPYDIKIVCHPDFDIIFNKVGCTHTYLLPWCVDDKEVSLDNEETKIYEVGWAGRFDGRFYSHRRKALNQLQTANFVMNDINKHYSWNEMFRIYKQSKVVVNISRDDFLEDANMRCFETMGAGSLMIIKMPTELTKLGFINGEHFIGLDNLDNLSKVVKYYLNCDEERLKISLNGQRKVLKCDTYLKRAETLVNIIKDNKEIAISSNIYRKMSNKIKMQQLAYSYWKDGDIQKIFECLVLSKSRIPFYLFILLLKLFLIKLKRILI